MKNWLLVIAPLLFLLLVVPMDAQAERLLLTGSGEIQKRVTPATLNLKLY